LATLLAWVLAFLGQASVPAVVNTSAVVVGGADIADGASVGAEAAASGAAVGSAVI
jgi:carbonic anhydrase/acetyltransferase-like protein (isoleucine patch superfamily)